MTLECIFFSSRKSLYLENWDGTALLCLKQLCKNKVWMICDIQKAQILCPEFSEPQKSFSGRVFVPSGAVCELLLRNGCPLPRMEGKEVIFFFNVKEGVFRCHQSRFLLTQALWLSFTHSRKRKSRQPGNTVYWDIIYMQCNYPF